MRNLMSSAAKVLMSVSVITSLTTNALACDVHGKTGFAPENNRYIPVGLKSAGGINEVQFNKIMDKLQKLYTPVVAARGAKFVIEKRWTDGTVNAYAEQDTPGVFGIHMFGGLARHSLMTVDGMTLVACHELGHHLGGAPKKLDGAGKVRWATNEGQADYWGTMKCLRNFFQDEDNAAAIKNLVVSPVVKESCTKQFANVDEQNICIRATVAGDVLGNVLADLGGESKVSINTPDQSVVKVMYHNHPEAQCRLDTYFQASLCDVSYKDAVSDTDMNTGVCSLRNGDTVGNRPLCWFKPE